MALIASADNGHAHDPDGPYGFDPAAEAYDAQLQEILDSGRLDFLPLAELVEPAKADSLWQLATLQGAVEETARAGGARIRSAHLLRDARGGDSDGGVELPRVRDALECVGAAIEERGRSR